MSNKMEEIEKILADHDCKLSPDSSCQCVGLVITLSKLKKQSMIANSIKDLNRGTAPLIRHWQD